MESEDQVSRGWWSYPPGGCLLCWSCGTVEFCLPMMTFAKTLVSLQIGLSLGLKKEASTLAVLFIFFPQVLSAHQELKQKILSKNKTIFYFRM